MTIFGRVVRWLRGRPVWAGNRYDPGDTGTVHTMNIITESTLESPLALESLLERAALWPLGGVEFSTGRFGSMENSEFVEAYSQVGWECVNECNWGRTWERTWERTVK